MTTSKSEHWHADDASLRAYAAGSSMPMLGASIEAHLMVCSDCRDRFRPLLPADPLENVWEAIRLTVEAPRRSLVERLLGWLGVSAESARLLAAVPALRGAWLLGLLTVTVFAGAAALLSDPLGLAAFLLVAPLAPVAGVAASFGGDADPSHELVSVTPHSALRLLLLRTAGVLMTSVPPAILVGLALPGPAWVGVAWLTPAAAGVTLVLALAPSLGCTTAATAVGVAWSVAVLTAARLREPLAVIEPAMQLVFVVLALAAAALLVLRYRSFDQLGRQT